MKKLPQRDPVGATRRRAIAQRRVGEGARCACGEARPEALIEGADPMTCGECQRKARGQSEIDLHHVAGRANSPITVPVPLNDHRAELTRAQGHWPKETRDNPKRSPLRAAAGSIRGFVDYVVYLLRRSVLWVADLLEILDDELLQRFGPRWWIGTLLQRFAPGQGGRHEA